MKHEVSFSLSASAQEELLALARMLRRARGAFALGFARCNIVPLRERLVDMLQDALEVEGVTIQQVTLTAETSNIYTALDAALAGKDDGDPLFVYGLAQAMPSRDPEKALAQLNEQRSLYQRLSRPLILWLPEYALRLVARQAPDFWAWRSGVYEFTLPDFEREALLEQEVRGVGWTTQWNLDRAAREARLHLLRGLLEEYEQEARGGKQDEVALRARAETLRKLADLERTLIGYEPAQRRLREALHIYKDLGDRRGVGVTQHDLADLHKLRGDYEQAKRLYRAAMEAADKLGNQRGVAVIQHDLADLHRLRGDYKQAEQLYRAAMETAEKLDNPRGVAVIQGDMAELQRLRGDYEQAERLHRASLETFKQLGDRREVAGTRGDLAHLHRLRGDYEQAERLLRAALETAKQLGDQREVSVTQHGLAELHRLRGDYDEAERLYRAALETKKQLGDRRGVAVTQGDLAELHRLRGDYDEAERLLRAALETAEQLGDQHGVTVMLRNLALLRRDRGRPGEALELLTRRRDTFAALELQRDVAEEEELIAQIQSTMETP